MESSATRKQVLLSVALALVAPIAIMSAYLWLSRDPDWWTSFSDQAAFVVAVAVGLVGILRLPLQKLARVVLAVLYVPAAGAGLIFFTLSFVCGMFGDCL